MLILKIKLFLDRIISSRDAINKFPIVHCNERKNTPYNSSQMVHD